MKKRERISHIMTKTVLTANEKDELKGIVTITDVVKYLLEQYD
ncbi:hypothetical protein FLCH110379_12410 [Flavobacterium chungbukense]